MRKLLSDSNEKIISTEYFLFIKFKLIILIKEHVIRSTGPNQVDKKSSFYGDVFRIFYFSILVILFKYTSLLN